MPQACIISLQAGDVRKFMGAGIVLFPARKVTAGLATRIMKLLAVYHRSEPDTEFLQLFFGCL
jgi:hypothetical protein